MASTSCEQIDSNGTRQIASKNAIGNSMQSLIGLPSRPMMAWMLEGSMRPNNALEWPVTRFTPAFGRPLNASVGGKEMIVRVIVCSLCSAFGAVATLSAAEPLSGPESTRAVAWLWTLHQSPIEMTGSRYVVDLAGMKVTADKDPNGDYAREK